MNGAIGHAPRRMKLKAKAMLNAATTARITSRVRGAIGRLGRKIAFSNSGSRSMPYDRIAQMHLQEGPLIAGLLHLNHCCSIRRGVAATLFVSAASAMIAPYRIAEVQRAGVGGRANNRAADSTNRGARRRIACRRADQRTRTGTNQTA